MQDISIKNQFNLDGTEPRGKQAAQPAQDFFRGAAAAVDQSSQPLEHEADASINDLATGKQTIFTRP